jgi:hypothetical protein
MKLNLSNQKTHELLQTDSGINLVLCNFIENYKTLENWEYESLVQYNRSNKIFDV